MTVTINVPNGKPRKSQNLRGLLDYARVQPPRLVRLYISHTGRATYDVVYANEAWSTGNFADWRVMRDWFKARRSWDCQIIDCLPA